MIKYNDKAVTPTEAAKRLLLDRGINHCIDFFNPSECNDFGYKDSEMPTKKEQEKIYTAYYVQAARVQKFLRLS